MQRNQTADLYTLCVVSNRMFRRRSARTRGLLAVSMIFLYYPNSPTTCSTSSKISPDLTSAFIVL